MSLASAKAAAEVTGSKGNDKIILGDLIIAFSISLFCFAASNAALPKATISIPILANSSVAPAVTALTKSD